MVEEALIVGSFALAALATVLLVRILRRNRRRRGAPTGRLNDRLAETHTVERTHLERPPRVSELATVGRTDDGAPVVVPIVEVELGSTEPPSEELAFEFVASVLRAIHPELSERSVRHYDVRFRFGPSGLLVSRNCMRIAVTPALAERLVAEDDYRPRDLRRAVRRADDGDEAEAPVLWGECRSY
ncbi:hypothetical protein [Halovivax sp.]|uniref:hypothetical protein n=1 Tax=Halovivax sp. TaxID=1935978 RepID=UPI0025C29338|nr:hypothetical protein [Halovivax sp.]